MKSLRRRVVLDLGLDIADGVDGWESMSWILALTLSMVSGDEGLATGYPSGIVL